MKGEGGVAQVERDINYMWVRTLLSFFHSISFIIKYLHEHIHTWSDKFNIEWVCHKQTVKNGKGNGNSE